MSIFKETLDPFVQKQLLLRGQIRQRRDTGQYTNSMLLWENSKTAFARMTSAVDVIDPTLAKILGVSLGNDLAKKHILQGGELFYENNKFSMRRGLGDGGGAYGDLSNKTRTDNGLRPMAGINSVSVQSRGAYGALRDVTVNFQCWTMEEMDRLSLLYQRPGYCVLVEWGWTQYLHNDQYNGNYDKLSTSSYYNILDNPLEKQQIFEDLFGEGGRIEKGCGNYDAHLGYVRNFSMKKNEQSGWDCSVVLVSIGEIIESLKMNYVSELGKETILGIGEKIPPVVNPPLFPPNNDVNRTNLYYQDVVDKGKPDSYYQSKLIFIFDSILRQAGKSESAKSTGFSMINVRGAYINDPSDQLQNYSDYQVYVGKLSEVTGTTYSSERFAAYISMSNFIDIMNYSIIVHDQTNKPFVHLTVKDSKGKELFCNSHYLQFSIDPRICVVRPCENKELCPPQIRVDHPNLPAYMLQNGLYNMGIIGRIYLNVRFLRNLINDCKNSDGYVDMSTYFDRLFKELNRSLGGINNFNLYPDTRSDRVYITDLNYLENKGAAKKVDDKFVFKLETYDTVARSYEIESKIFPSQSTISATAAQAGGGGGVVGVESFTFDLFNRGIQDRIIKEKYEPGTKTRSAQQKKQDDQQKEKTWVDFANRLSAIKNLLENQTTGAFFPQDDISEGLHRLILSETKLQLQRNKVNSLGGSGIIPVLLTVRLDGIGGIVVGQIFRVNEDKCIPLSARGSGKMKIGFIVKEVNHTLEGNDWVTDIVTQTCVLDTGEPEVQPKKNEIFKSIRFTKVEKRVGDVVDDAQGK